MFRRYASTFWSSFFTFEERSVLHRIYLLLMRFWEVTLNSLHTLSSQMAAQSAWNISSLHLLLVTDISTDLQILMEERPFYDIISHKITWTNKISVTCMSPIIAYCYLCSFHHVLFNTTQHYLHKYTLLKHLLYSICRRIGISVFKTTERFT